MAYNTGFQQKLYINIPGVLQRQRKIDIIQDLDGLVEAGEMLVVLGPPGSGCSTFLKTITGETHGFVMDKSSNLNFQGMPDIEARPGLLLIATLKSERRADGNRFQRGSHLHG